MIRTRSRGDEGVATVELALMTPVLVAVLLLVVLAGRVATLSADVQSAARDAARAASLRDTPSPARADGEAVARGTLENRGQTCIHLVVEIGTDDLGPGGRVRSTVTCQVALSDLGFLALPGSKTVSASSTSVVDTYRSSP